jgi:hypothetical protein
LRDNANPKTQKDLLDWFRHAPLRMPRTQTELFQLLATYNPAFGWDAFAGTIDFSGITPRQICQVVLGRHPATVEQAIAAPDYDARQHFRAALVSREFRKRFLGYFLQAYRSKGRDIFIHVPKCAGTDLILNLGWRSVPLPKMLEVEGWTSDSEFLEIMAGLARAAASSDRLFIYGHMELGEYIDIAGIRPDDCLFTVLRDPVDLMVSQANYAVGRLRQDPTGQQPDAADYLRMLGLTHLPDTISSGELKNLTFKALLNPTVTESNRACFFLGRGSKAVFATALENLILHNAEITTTENYSRWLLERWGISSGSRHNRSEPILSNVEARRLCGAALADASTEDRKLYDVVSWALQEAGSASIKGQHLAALIGARLTDMLSTNEPPVMPTRARPGDAGQQLLVAESAERVEMYLSPVSAAVPGAASIETVLAIGFGNDADGKMYRRDGWAPAETDFTWTAARQSTIQLPTLAGEGRFIVRLIASPFVVPQLRPFQEVEVLIEGIRFGACRVTDVSVLEVVVPPAMLTENNRLTLTLRLPTATRPSEVVASKDQRELALAVRSMTILRVLPAAV